MLQRVCLVVGLLVGVAAGGVWGASPNDPYPKAIRKGGVGLKIGLINTGMMNLTGWPTPDDSVAVRDYEMNPVPAACGQVYFDVAVSPKLSLLFAADVYDVRFERLSERAIDVSAGFKLAFYQPRARIAWRPGASVGLGYLADIGFMRPTTYLTLKAFTELVVFPKRGQPAVVFDLGVMAMPTGGNSTVDARVAPSVYLRAGLLY